MEALKVQVAHEERVNLVAFTDPHLAAVPPGRRRATYPDEILRKIDWVAELTTMVRGAALCSGDVFHVKNPRSPSNTHGFVNRVMSSFFKFPTGRVYGAVGNHDITGDNLSTLPDQPLGLLITSGAYCDLSYQPVIFETNGLRVQVDAYDYLPGDQLLEKIKETREDNEAMEFYQVDWDERPYHYRVALVHAFNQPGASGWLYQKDFALGWDDLEDSAYDVFLWGHDHCRKGINQKHPHAPWHVQLGSLSRAALSSDEVNRPVSVAVLSFSKQGIKIVEKEVPVTPLELAFHTATLEVEQVERGAAVSAFLQELDAKAQEVEAENPLDILRNLTQDPEILKTIQDACELH